MEEEVKAITQKYQICQTQLSNLIVAKQELEVKLREVEEQFKIQVLQHEQDLKDSKSDIDYLAQQNKDLNAALEMLKKQEPVDNREDSYKSLSLVHERNLSIIASQESYIAQLESQNLTLTDQTLLLEQSNNKLREKRKILVDEQNFLRSKNRELAENLEKVTREAEKIIAEQARREDSRKNQQDEYMAVVKKHSKLEKKHKDLQLIFDKLEKELVSKNDRINSVRSSKALIESKLKDEEKKNDELNRRIKILESSVKYQRRPDSAEVSQYHSENDFRLAESERKLNALLEKLQPLMNRNSQLEKLIEKQNVQINQLKNIQKDMSSTITFLNLELADYKKDGISLISPKPSTRKSQFLAFQNSSGIDKSYRMDPSRFSPLKNESGDIEGINPNLEIPTAMWRGRNPLSDSEEFGKNSLISAKEIEEE